MEIITGTEEFYLEVPTAVAMGKFDGIHIGHQRLLTEILTWKERGLKSCVFTFDPAPAVFFGKGDGRELTTREEKRLILERLGIDLLVEFPMNENTASMDPEVFIRRVLGEQLNTRFLAAGKDVTFGHKGAGDGNLLLSLSEEVGYEVSLIEKITWQEREVSSTFVRELVEQGDMVQTETLLGMPYQVAGEVAHGRQIGRTLQMPTTNLIPPSSKLLPPFGVYFAKVFAQGKYYTGISNIGRKPTVSETEPVGVETYLYDFTGDLYGQKIIVELLQFKRPEKRFASLEELKEQLEQDKLDGITFFSEKSRKTTEKILKNSENAQK